MHLANLHVPGERGLVIGAVRPDGQYLYLRDAFAAAAGAQFRGQSFGHVPDALIDVARNHALLAQIPEIAEQLEREGRLDKFLLPADTSLDAPIPNPVRILAIGRNYAEHAREQGNEVFGEPIVFLKASTSVIGSGQSIEIPDWVGRVDYEAELLVVLGEGGKDVAEADAMRLVAGYSVFNDVTARAQQKKDIENKHPWFRSKSMDTSGPMGPVLVTADEIADPHDLSIQLRVNGELRQEDRTSSMVFRIPTLIAFLSKWFRLYPGDVIATGTPSGIGPLVPGDVVEASVEGIGTLQNPVVGI